MKNWPMKWGFIGDLRECAGKTIELVELVKMEHGAVSRTAWAIRFTDGSRAFVTGRPTTHIMTGPSEKAIETCQIFMPSELGEMVTERKRCRDQYKREQLQKKRHQLEQLKKELGEA